MYTSTLVVIVAAAAGLVSAAPGNKRDNVACPAWAGASPSLTKTSATQCCLPGEKNELNCCFTSGTRGINSDQLLCDSLWFRNAENWSRFERCNTLKVPQTACNGVAKLPAIMAKNRKDKPSA